MTSPHESDTQNADTSSFWERHSNRLLGGAVPLVLLVGTLTYSVIEDWSLLDSFYFSSVALTAVGFGDLTPSTDLSKLFTVFYIFSGVSIVGVWLNFRLKRRSKKAAHRRNLDFDHTPDAAPAAQPDPPTPPAIEG